MFLSIILKAFLFAFGVLWCRSVFRRFRSDVGRLKVTQDSAERAAIIFFWGLTAVILVLMIYFAAGLVMNIAGAF